MHRCWYDVNTYGSASADDLDCVKQEILVFYPIQVFNNTQLGEHAGRWDEMEEVMTGLSRKYPDILFCVTAAFEDIDDDEPADYYFGNGHMQDHRVRKEHDALSPELFGDGLDLSTVPQSLLFSGQISVSGSESLLTITPTLSDGELVLNIEDAQGYCYAPLHTGIER